MAAAHVVNGSSGPRRIPLYIGFLLRMPRFWINIIAEDSLYTSSMALVVRLHPQLSGLAIKSRPHRCLTACILYTTKGTSSFQVERLLQARSRGRGRGARAPPEIFRLELNSATTVEFFY